MTEIDERATAAESRSDGDGTPADAASPFVGQQAYERRQRLRRARSGRRQAAVAWLVALAIVAAAVYGGIRLAGYRLAGQAQLELGPATLTASPVSVSTPGDGQVVHVYVHPGERVRAGAKLMLVRLLGSSSGGRPSSSPATITAPTGGIVSSVAAPEGDAILRGDLLVQLYDPHGDTFETPIDMGTLGRLSKGMHATLTSPALPHPIAAVVDHVVEPASAAGQPPAQTTTASATTPGTVMLVLRPVHPGALGALIPGLKANVVVDTATGPKHAPSLARVSS